MMMTGKVFLVGAGPGDPDLITLRGVRALQQADVVLYDRLAHSALLDHAPRYAMRMFAGRAPGEPAVDRQASINRRLIHYALAGRTVVRLKGGDPFVFGRGGEEALALAEAGVPFEVVPGISAAIAVPSAAMIPVTHRGVSTAFGVFTGHEATETSSSGTDWALAARMPTALFLMGVLRLSTIVAQLLAHGRDPKTPAAVIEKGTLPEQRVFSSTLGDILAVASDAVPPATVVIGDVVALRARLIAPRGPEGRSACWSDDEAVLAGPASLPR